MNIEDLTDDPIVKKLLKNQRDYMKQHEINIDQEPAFDDIEYFRQKLLNACNITADENMYNPVLDGQMHYFNVKENESNRSVIVVFTGNRSILKFYFLYKHPNEKNIRMLDIMYKVRPNEIYTMTLKTFFPSIYEIKHQIANKFNEINDKPGTYKNAMMILGTNNK